MPLSREKMAEYQRQRRAKGASSITPEVVDTARAAIAKDVTPSKTPARAKSAPRVSELPIAMDLEPGHKHEWRRAEMECICDDCGEIVPYTGSSLPRYTDGLPEWPEIIQRLPSAEISRLLGRINSKQRER